MKTNYLLPFFIFLFSIFNAQTIIKPEKVNTDLLSEILKKENYKILEKENDYIKIENEHGSFLFLDLDLDVENPKYIFMNSAITVAKKKNKQKIQDLMNKINNLSMIKVVNTDQEDIEFRYYFWMTNGFVKETFIDAVSEFFLYQGDAFNIDKEEIFSYK